MVRLALLAFVLLGALACAAREMAPVDLSAPDWTVWRGQAVWTREAEVPPLAGELIVARHRSGDVLIDFSKPPFPIFTARTASGSWRIDFVERGRSYSGRGEPPRRFVWFRLPEILEGVPVGGNWRAERVNEYRWSLVNGKTGESIRLVLDG
jgi:hypothetical protein